MNWKDAEHPEAGGAEVFTHEIAMRMVKKGHAVTLFASSFSGAPSEEVRDGIVIIRRGTKTSVQNEAKQYYHANLGSFDLVVDEVNTRPFMSPDYARCKTIAVIHQLAKEVWFYETPLPIAVVGSLFFEKYWLRKYRNTTTVTVSESSKRDLVSLGFRDVHVIRDGLSYSPLPDMPTKERFPVIVYLGRLTRAKRVNHLISAFAKVRAAYPASRLWIIGDGPDAVSLRRQASDAVIFSGRVDKRRVIELLRSAWVLAYPSVREGFGLAVIEANAHGTPAVGYDVPGIRDSIIDGLTGILVPDGDVEALSSALLRIVEETKLREILSRNALDYSRGFSWDRTAKDFLDVIEGLP